MREVCRIRRINHFFLEILGSPLSKESNFTSLLSRMNWSKDSCLFIGDTINDLETARLIGIDFIAKKSNFADWSTIPDVRVINDFSELQLV